MIKFLAVLLVGVLGCISVWAKEITILHTNDIHCAVDEGVELSGVAWLKKTYQQAEMPVVLVDAGDAVQGAPLGTLSRGAAIIRLMNAAGYDFAIPGNHEFDYGMEDFKTLAGSLQCGYYSANILEGNKFLFEAYKMFSFDNIKVAFVGVTTPETLLSADPMFFRVPGNPKKLLYYFGGSDHKHPAVLYRYVQRAVDNARKKGARYVILVVHMGNHGVSWGVRDLVKNIRGADAVIDGHSHEDYVENMPDYDGRMIPVTQTGTRLSCVGRIVIGDDGKITADKVRFLAGKDPVVEEGVEIEKKDFEKMLVRIVGNTTFPLYTVDSGTGERLVRRGETNLGDWAADACRKVFQTDIGIMNGGSLRSGLGEGNVTFRDILSISPFCNRMCVVRLSGREILDMLEYSVHRYPEEFGGFLQVSGLTFDVDISIPSPVKLKDGGFGNVRGDRRVKNVKVQGEPLDMDRIYSVAGNSYILASGGNGYSMFIYNVNRKMMRMTDVDVLQEYLYTGCGGIVPESYRNPSGGGRINVLK